MVWDWIIYLKQFLKREFLFFGWNKKKESRKTRQGSERLKIIYSFSDYVRWWLYSSSSVWGKKGDGCCGTLYRYSGCQVLDLPVCWCRQARPAADATMAGLQCFVLATTCVHFSWCSSCLNCRAGWAHPAVAVGCSNWPFSCFKKILIWHLVN